MSIELYPPPFIVDDFYAIPLVWLTDTENPADLDTREVLLFRLDSELGRIRFVSARQAEDIGGPASRWESEHYWSKPDLETPLRELFSRQSYTLHRQRLVDRGLITPLSTERSKQSRIMRELHPYIEYQVAGWPLNSAVIYRPRAYLLKRWPAWLGNRSGLAARAVLLALLNQAHQQLRNQPSANLFPLTATWSEICRFIEQHLPTALHERPAERRQAPEIQPAPSAPTWQQTVDSKLRKGVQDLKVLGLITEQPLPLRYSLQLDVFQGSPQWSLDEIAHCCRLELPRDQVWVELVRDLLDCCCEPASLVTTISHALLTKWRKSPYLRTHADLAEFRRFIQHSRRPGRLPRAAMLLDDFLAQRKAQGTTEVSDSLTLTAHAVACVGPLLLPQAQRRYVKDIQLIVQPESETALSVAAVQQSLAHLDFVIWQANEAADPTLIPIRSHQPQPSDVAYGFVLRANQLLDRLDYRRPFEVLLKCAAPEPRLTLTCCFRLLLAQRALRP